MFNSYIKKATSATSHSVQNGTSFRSDYPQSFRTKVRNHTSSSTKFWKLSTTQLPLWTWNIGYQN